MTKDSVKWYAGAIPGDSISMKLVGMGFEVVDESIKEGTRSPIIT